MAQGSVTTTTSTAPTIGSDKIDASSMGMGSRIPKTLQAVFLASNRGNEVHLPPPKKVAFKVFLRKLLTGGGGGGNKGKKDKDNKSKDTATSTQASIDASFKKKSTASAAGRSGSKKAGSAKAVEIKDPQAYLDHLMRSRGYCTKKYNTLKTAYRNKPTALQVASYDLHLIGLIKGQEADELDDILKAGISPNPCNNYGESLVHMVCRRGDKKLLQVMIQNGCNIQVADDYGRTPLHDACWAAEPAFETVQMLLDQDPTLLQMTDVRGFLPLTYVRKDHWPQWIEFLDSKANVYWPNLIVNTTSFEHSMHSTTSTVCEYVEQDPDTRPLMDPTNALPLDLANMVASGKLKPEEAIILRNQRSAKYEKRSAKGIEEGNEEVGDGDNDDDEDDDEDDDDEDEQDEDDSEYDSDYDDDDEDFSEAEMNELMGQLTIRLGSVDNTALSSDLKQ